ncbi:stage III sporulation protein AF [Paenibacillus algicola]|uniref:Stage III sporulation protein AF n=1 Tax=Paenibacillus algicola TaxID=2565926 RepID=A0A4P8XIM8_9BACL|nr:stage III sporulation protein AF [Paenibacillus algicola]QCT02462.1 stage III sporulation protein AF [Paenibacillus algicola]
MDWLSEWLRNVILIVIFAALVELLLPGNSMQRYARLVLSLMVLLALLQPILQLFHEAPEVRLAEQLESIEQGSKQAQTGLAQILAQAEDIKETRERQSLQWAAEQAALEMKKEIAAETGEEPEAVEVSLLLQEAGRGSEPEPVISSVVVRLRPPGENMNNVQTPSGSGRKDIEPVSIDPVVIEVEQRPDDSEQEVSAQPYGAEQEAWLKAQEAAVKKLLRASWSIQEKNITVTAENKLKEGARIGKVEQEAGAVAGR